MRPNFLHGRFYAIAVLCLLFTGIIQSANFNSTDYPDSFMSQESTWNDAKNESIDDSSIPTTESKESVLDEKQGFNVLVVGNVSTTGSMVADISVLSSTTDNKNVTEVGESFLSSEITSANDNNSTFVMILEKEQNITDNTTFFSFTIDKVVAVTETSSPLVTSGKIFPNDSVSFENVLQNWSAVVALDEREFNVSTTILPIETGDAAFNKALLLTLITVASLGIISLCIIFIWRRWHSQLSGEWVLNKNVRQYSRVRETNLGGFENECYTADYKFSPVSSSSNESAAQFSRPLYTLSPIYVSKKDNSSNVVNQTRSCDSRDQIEMIEMMQKASSTANEDTES